ncbi:MAG: polyphosphate polymerase domain-containing protein [Eubacteriales bacterium]|nr:polyphosphate polymerase domain-containing protein [Eubacteriales bacterium]
MAGINQMEQRLSVFRSELKYMMNEVKASALEEEVRRFLMPDTYSKNGSYRVKSLYFDTINNKDFYDKRDGENIKKKIRLRTYDENSNILKLECKQKVGSLQQKTSLVISRNEAKALMNADYSFLLNRSQEGQTACKFYCILELGAYRPTVMVEYDRKAYTYPEYNTRITFDRNVRYSEINLNIFDPMINYNYALLENTILEVKYNKTLVQFVKRILKSKKLTNISYGKYEWCRVLLQQYAE